MDIYEIAGYKTAIARDGVNFLEPADSFQNIENGYVYRQELVSRKGFKLFSQRRVSDNTVTDNTRIMGIFEFIHKDNTKELLVITKKFLYTYNEGTDVFDRIQMNSAVAITDFGITSNESYVSGTTYPFANGNNRFVFTGKGMSDTFFYDPTPVTGGVKRFTLVADNPNYQAPAAGALTNAWYVLWFGERLNLFNPSIASLPNPQMVLYSGIRTSTGNGDKFAVPGSGSLSADTYEYINGASILGNFIVGNFSRSNWVLEKTRDAFNPYFWRKIPSVLGTDAAFSFVSWNDQVYSVGKTGVIGTDGRDSVRVDDRIPYFTTDDIDQLEFDLTYGGFDRINGQFLFAYPSATADEPTTQDKVLVRDYEEKTWAINDQRFSVFGQTDKGHNYVWNDIYEVNSPDWLSMDTTEEIWNKIGIEESTQKTLAGDDLGFVYDINVDYDDYFVNIVSIANGATTTLTIPDSAFMAGDQISISNVQGLTQINNFDESNPSATFQPYTVISATTTSITINFVSTNLPAATPATGSVSKIINFKAETIPFNPYRSDGRMCRISHVEFLLNTNGGSLLVDVFQDEDDDPFKSNVLIEPTSTTKNRQWITMTVDNEANFMTFVLKQSSPAVQVILTSMRIHCEPGGYTSA